MRRWFIPVLIACLAFLATVTPALAPRRPASDLPTPLSIPHPEAEGKPDRTGYIKAIYVSYAAMGHTGFSNHVQDLLENTEINAVVLDFKGDRGLLSFPTQVPLALEIGAGQAPVIRDPLTYLNWFKQRNIYTIARIVTFKDNVLAQARPAWAITDATASKVWRDHEGMGWVDPFQQATWDYNTALALEAARIGFDEIQFDYIRFPTDGRVASARYALPSTSTNRTGAITGFLKQVRQATAPHGTKISIDTFGYTAWVHDDLGIGQQVEALAPYVDVLSPMLYPSTFDAGLPGLPARYKDAIAYPYDIVYLSTQRTLHRGQAINPNLEVRPWIQDFRDYTFDGRRYTPAEIRLQMEGARMAGGRGWLLWDPAVQYTRQALVSARPSYTPNPAGKVLVVAYGNVEPGAGANPVAPETLRADLELLLASGFYPINLRDLTEGKLKMVPAGKRPVALTFDGAIMDQLRLLPDGAVAPTCAVGVLIAMHDQHPADWPLRATFFVRAEAGPTDGAELAAPRLQWLVAEGMEVGLLHPADQPLETLAEDETQRLLARAVGQISDWLPNYTVSTIALPEGGSAAHLRRLMTAMNLEDIRFSGAALPSGGLTAAPSAPDFDPFRVTRVPAQELAQWVAQAAHLNVHYVSGGE